MTCPHRPGWRSGTIAAVAAIAGLLAWPAVAAASVGSWGFNGDDQPADRAKLATPSAVALVDDGGFLIADTENHRIRRVAPDGIITTVAGNADAGLAGDGGPATDASLNLPADVAVTADGGFLIADSGNDRIRRVRPDGTIETVRADLALPQGVDVAPDGAILVSDTLNHRVLRLTSAGGVQTVAGTGTAGRGADRGLATALALNHPIDIVATDTGFYVADAGNERVRRVTSAGLIETVAGTGNPGFSEDGVDGALADLAFPSALSLEPDGGLLIADTYNQRIRRLDQFGTIDTVAGIGAAADLAVPGDEGRALQSQLSYPRGVASTGDEGFLVVDTQADRVRQVSADGSIITVAGVDVRRPKLTFRVAGGSGSGTRHLNPWRFDVIDRHRRVRRGEKLKLCVQTNLQASLKISVRRGSRTVRRAALDTRYRSLGCRDVPLRRLGAGRYRVVVVATHRDETQRDTLRLTVLR